MIQMAVKMLLISPKILMHTKPLMCMHLLRHHKGCAKTVTFSSSESITQNCIHFLYMN